MAFPFILLISCEGSRTRRMIDSGKKVYEYTEETGDYTWLIISIVLLVFCGVLKLWKNNDK